MNARGLLQFLLGLLFLAAAVMAFRAGWFAPVERRAQLDLQPSGAPAGYRPGCA
jgi:hypothetical protein